MARYIDEEKLLKDIGNIPEGHISDYDAGRWDIRRKIIEQPTADAAEVKHGEWRQSPYCKRIYYCSECGRHIEDGSNSPTEYFPYCHCGAKMDGKPQKEV